MNTTWGDTYLLFLSLTNGLAGLPCRFHSADIRDDLQSLSSAAAFHSSKTHKKKKKENDVPRTCLSPTSQLVVFKERGARHLQNQNTSAKRRASCFIQQLRRCFWMCAIAFNCMPAFISFSAGEVVTTAAAGSFLSTHQMDFYSFFFPSPVVKLQIKSNTSAFILNIISP